MARVVQADQDGFFSHRLAKRGGIDPAFAIDADLRAAEALALEPGDRAEHGRVLDRGGDNVTAETPLGQGGTLDCVVDRLGAAGGEQHLPRLGGVHQLGQVRPGLVDGVARLEAWPVQRRRRAELLAQPRLHGGDHFRQRPGGGEVVEVNHLGPAGAWAGGRVISGAS